MSNTDRTLLQAPSSWAWDYSKENTWNWLQWPDSRQYSGKRARSVGGSDGGPDNEEDVVGSRVPYWLRTKEYDASQFWSGSLVRAHKSLACRPMMSAAQRGREARPGGEQW